MAFAGAAVTAYASYRTWRIDMPKVDATPDPALDYENALARLELLRDQDGPLVNPVCRTRLLTHGQRTTHAIAIFHGLSNCPQQFAQLAADLHATGYNVLLARLPGHGFERLSDEQAGMTVEGLIATANQVVDIMHGLGERVTVMGLSAGGALAAWCAQNRADVDRVVAISPALGLISTPYSADRLFTNLFGVLPNFFVWWDSELKDAVPGPPHAYPRFSSRAVSTLIRLGKIVQIQAGREPPAVDDALIILNPKDNVVRNVTARNVASDWRRHGMNVSLFEFPAEWDLPHDLIDPSHVEPRVEIVYPVLMALVLNGRD